jgi:hypothetical protein
LRSQSHRKSAVFVNIDGIDGIHHKAKFGHSLINRMRVVVDKMSLEGAACQSSESSK